MENGTNTERTVLDMLRQSVREIDAEYRETQIHLAELAARRHELEEQVARTEGDPLCAEWHRLSAVWCRTPTAETEQAAHAAYVAHLAAMHLRNGTVPREGSHAAEEIEAHLDALRAEVRQ